MTEQTILCPKCQAEIPLSAALTSQIEDRLRRDLESEIHKREQAVREDYERRLAAAKGDLQQQAAQALATEMTDLRDQIAEKSKQLDEARVQELDLRRRQRELEDREQSLSLEVARKLDEERQRIRLETGERLAEEYRFKELEKEKQLNDLRKEIEDLRRKAEQGSQQTQGEVAELELEQALAATFPHDLIEPIGKGVRGADVLQKIHLPTGQYCGSILWESKNTKTWGGDWIAKLKDDQREKKADLAVLASVALPKEVAHFAYQEGVWVTGFPYVIGIATALRASLIQVAMARLAATGKNEKMEMLYGYLSGTEFRQRVEAIVESFVAMKDDLDKERRATEKAWAKRDKQIQRVTQNVAGMYGEMQGIIGKSLPEIESLQLPAPDPRRR